MRCVVCGRKLKKHKQKYCCQKCAQVGYKKGLARSIDNTEKQVAELWGYFKRAFDVGEEKIGSLNAWKMRVFVCACYEMGHRPNSIGRGMKKDHSVVIYHHKRVSEEEKKIALDFLKDSKNYIYINKLRPKSIYPEGFHY